MYGDLKRLATQEKTTMSKIIREGITLIVDKIDRKNNAIKIEEDKNRENLDERDAIELKFEALKDEYEYLEEEHSWINVEAENKV